MHPCSFALLSGALIRRSRYNYGKCKFDSDVYVIHISIDFQT